MVILKSRLANGILKIRLWSFTEIVTVGGSKFHYSYTFKQVAVFRGLMQTEMNFFCFTNYIRFKRLSWEISWSMKSPQFSQFVAVEGGGCSLEISYRLIVFYGGVHSSMFQIQLVMIFSEGESLLKISYASFLFPWFSFYVQFIRCRCVSNIWYQWGPFIYGNFLVFFFFLNTPFTDGLLF